MQAWLHREARYRAHDHAPHLQLIVFLKADRRIGRILRMELDYPIATVQAFDRVFVIDHGQHDMAVPGFDGAVHRQHIAVVDVGTGHGVAHDAKEEGGRLVPHQVGIEIQRLLAVVVGRGGEPGRDAMIQYRQAAIHRGEGSTRQVGQGRGFPGVADKGNEGGHGGLF